MRTRRRWQRAHLAATPAQLLLSATGIGAAAVVVMWSVNTPKLTSAADCSIALARLTGLLTGFAVAVLIALMARVPVLERSVGADLLSRWHARGGRYVTVALTVHVGSVVWGYARSSRVSLTHQVALLLWNYPDVLLATVAAAVLIGVGITSVRAVRLAVGYNLWYSGHLCTYIAVALAFSHQFANGTDFVYHPVARAAWTALYVAVALAVAYYRVVGPAIDFVRRRFTVDRIVGEGNGAVSISLRGRNVARLGAESGQFFRLRFLSRGMWLQSHPFSLSAAPTSDTLRFTVKPVGDHTRRLTQLTVGTRVVAEGPFGTLTARRRRQRKVLLMAGGIGITPLRALFESMPAAGGELTLIYRCRTEAELTLRSELDALARLREASVRYLIGGRHDRGGRLDSQALLELVPDLVAHDVFLCMPGPMAADVTSALRINGVPPQHIHRESFELAAPSPSVHRQAIAVSLAVVGIATVVAIRRDLVSPDSRPTEVGRAVLRAGAAHVAGEPVAASSPAADVTIVGSLQRTLFTNVQVAAVLRNGKLVDVRPIRLPNIDARSRQISAMAAPILRREAIAAGSAEIDTVSGATYTSEAYATSLQAALDARH